MKATRYGIEIDLSYKRKTQCPKCAKEGKDRGGDNLNIYGVDSDGRHLGAFCFSGGCGFTIPSEAWVEENAPITIEDMEYEMSGTEFNEEVHIGVLIHGVGIRDLKYRVRISEYVINGKGEKVQKDTWSCPFYTSWKSMLTRAYSKRHLTRNPTYMGCSVSDEWLTFSAFKSWMEKQEWEGNQLDKDLLIKGNKLYSKETCVFISKKTNTFINEFVKIRGIFPLGVCWVESRGKFKAQISNPFTGKTEYLGQFDNPEEAHQAWLKRKLELARLLAEEQSDPRVANALIERYENYDIGDNNE